MGDYECKVEWDGEAAPVKTVTLGISLVSQEDKSYSPFLVEVPVYFPRGFICALSVCWF